jgi:hypothetical protein
LLRDILSELADVLRAEIADTLAGDGIDIVVEPRFVMQPSEGICLDMYPGDPARTSEAAAFGDLSGMYVVTVRARATVNDSGESIDVLTDMADDQHALSVAAAIESDDTLNGWATQVIVDADGFSGLGQFPVGTAAPMLGCTWRVLIGQAVS